MSKRKIDLQNELQPDHAIPEKKDSFSSSIPDPPEWVSNCYYKCIPCLYKLNRARQWSFRMLMIMFFDIVVSAFGVVLWFSIIRRLQHQHAFFVSQVLYPTAFVIIIWPFTALYYFLYKFRSIQLEKEHKKNTYGESNITEAEENAFEMSTKKEYDRHSSSDDSQNTDLLHQQDLPPPKKFKKLNSFCDRLCISMCIPFNKLPKRVKKRLSYVVMAVGDSLCGLLSILPIIYLSPTLITLFGQISLPLNMVAAFLLLKRRFNAVQNLCVVIILSAIFIVLFPTIYHELIISNTIFNVTSSNTNGSYYSNVSIPSAIIPAHHSDYTPNWILLLGINLISRIISTLCSIFKERVMKDYKMEPVMTVSIVATLQLPLSYLSLCYLALPLPFKGFGTKTAHELWLYFFDTWNVLLDVQNKCFHNNTITNSTFLNTYNNSDSGANDSDRSLCNIVPIFLLFLGINIITNVFDMLIIRDRDSTVNIICGIGTVVVSIFLFSFEAVAGSAYNPIGIHVIVALFLICIAVPTYSAYTPVERKRKVIKTTTYEDYDLEEESDTVIVPQKTKPKELSRQETPSIIELPAPLIFDNDNNISSDDTDNDDDLEKVEPTYNTTRRYSLSSKGPLMGPQSSYAATSTSTLMSKSNSFTDIHMT